MPTILKFGIVGTWYHELLALGVAVLTLLAALLATPSTTLLDVAPIEFVQRPGDRPYIVQRVRPRVPFVGEITYEARIMEVALPGWPPPEDKVVCNGDGTIMPRGTDPYERRARVEAWIDDPDCALRRGSSYYATVTWSFRFLGIDREFTQRTETITMPIYRTELGPTFPPAL
jgi:hypothetical protein